MQTSPLKSIAILGGGAAGWMSAAYLAKMIGGNCKIILIESEDIGIIGVGEATIPTVRIFNQRLGIDEQEFIRQTGGTYKLGIEFIDWQKKRSRYYHPFGKYGVPFDHISTHNYWLREHLNGDSSSLESLSLAAMAAEKGRFRPPLESQRGLEASLEYAYHFDASLYTKYLRTYAEKRGVKRVEGKVVDISIHRENGFIDRLTLKDGRQIKADFYIDCSGFASLLIGKALRTPYQDWSKWLPCNRAVAMGSKAKAQTRAHTQAKAQQAGWTWNIPLQNRTGNGYVYADAFTSDAKATQLLLTNLETKPLSEPRFIRFTPGRREKAWYKNCLSIGLSSGFLEPLESTSIHLIQFGLMRFVGMLPDKSCSHYLQDSYNQQTAEELEGIRDFLILHYTATQRDDSAFWNYCREMKIPDTLQERLEYFSETGLIKRVAGEMFGHQSWMSVLIGQGVLPKTAPMVTELRTGINVPRILERIRTEIDIMTNDMPTHDAYLKGMIHRAA